MPPFLWIGGDGDDLNLAANWERLDDNPDNEPPRVPTFSDDQAIINGGSDLHGMILPGSAVLNGQIELDQGIISADFVGISGNLTLDGLSEITSYGPTFIAVNTTISLLEGSVFQVGGSNIDLTDNSHLNVDSSTARTSLDVIVGNGAQVGGTSTLSVINTGLLQSGGGIIGDDVGSVGAATLDVGRWQVANNLYVGNGGTGFLTLNNSSRVHGTNGHSAVQDIHVGQFGDGYLNVYGGSSVEAEFITLGGQLGSFGALDVDSSSVSAYQGLAVGREGVGSLTLANGARIRASDVKVGIAFHEDEPSLLIVDNSDLIVAQPAGLGWGATGNLTIGIAGPATAEFVNGARVIARNISIADNLGSRADVTVDQSNVAADENITVGFAGIGTMTVTDSDIDAGGTTAIGVDAGHGDVLIRHSTFSSSAFLVGGGFGQNGVGRLIIDHDSIVTATGPGGSFGIGTHVGSDGTVVVAGEDTHLDASASADNVLTVGGSGVGRLTIQDHALLNTQTASIGSSFGGIGTVTLDTSGWVAFNVFVGGFGTGTLNVQNASALDTQGLHVATNGTGHLNISGQSRVRAFNMQSAGAAGSEAWIDIGGAVTTLNMWQGDRFIEIGGAGRAHLNVHDQATVVTGRMTVVGQAGGFADVTVSNATLTVDQTLTVGARGRAEMNVDSNAVVTTQATYAGSEDGSIATIMIDHASWAANIFGVAGGAGAGTANVTIQNAATVTITGTAGAFTIGDNAGSNGSVHVTGAGSILDVSGSADNILTIGNAGFGTLLVDDGAVLLSQNGFIGSQTGSTGTVTIDDASWTASDILVGAGGNGFLTVQGQGSVTAQDVTAGGAAGGIGNIGVAGGGAFTASTLILGLSTGSQGSADVAGLGSSLTVTGGPAPSVIVANFGDGNLTVRDQATATVDSMQVGLGSGIGSVVVDDAGLTVNQTLDVAIGGSANVFVRNGGSVTADAVTMAGAAGSTAAMSVDASTVTVDQDFQLGIGGWAHLNVVNGSTVSANAMELAANLGSTATLAVDASTVTVDQDLTTGLGAAFVTVTGSGNIQVGNDFTLAGHAGSTASLLVDDDIANLSVGGFLNVGLAGQATATFQNATIAEVNYMRIGRQAGSQGFVTVQGAGTHLTVENEPPPAPSPSISGLGIGGAGNGSMWITDHAQVDVIGAGFTNLALAAGSTGSLAVSNFGVLNTGNFTIGGSTTPGGTAFVSVSSGGVINATLTDPSLATSRMYSGTVDVSQGGSINLGNATSVAGAVHVGSGFASLVGAGTIIGDVVNDGAVRALASTAGNTLRITGDVTGTGQLFINPGATLQLGASSTVGVTFVNPTAAETLRLDQPGAFSGLISNIRLGDVIDLSNTTGVRAVINRVDATHASIDISTLAGQSYSYQTNGIATGWSFVNSGDGHGGTNLTLSNVSTAISMTFNGVALANDTGISVSDFITQDGHVMLAGTLSGNLNGLIVRVFDNGAFLGRAMVANGAWSLSADITATQGVHNFTASVNNQGGGTASAAAAQAVTIDTTAPDAPGATLHTDSGSSSVDGITNNGQVDVSGLQAGASWQNSINGGVWTAGIGTSLSVSGDGAHTVLVQQTDVAGNVSANASLSFTLDTGTPSAPGLALHTDSGNPTDQITNVGQVDVSGLELGAGWQYSLDGGTSWLGGTGTTLTVRSDGAHDVLVHQNDIAGNASADAAFSFTLDTAGPSAPALALHHDTGLPGDGITSNGQVDVSGLEPGAAWEYSLDGGAWAAGTGTSLTVSGEGAHDVLVRQTDVAGNVSADTAFSFTLDTAGPGTPGLALQADTGSPGDGITSNGQVNVSGLEAGAAWQYSIDGGVWTAGTGTSLAVSGDGAHSVRVHQTDAAGQPSAEATLSFTLDTTGPGAPGLALQADTGSPGDGITSNGQVDVSGLEQAGATWQYSIDDGAWTAGTGAGLAVSGDGAHTVRVQQTDAAGNLSADASLSLTLDTAAPSVTASYANGTLSGTGDPNAVVHFVVDGNPIAATATANGAGAWTFAPTGLASGPHTVVASETDAAGNVGSASVTFAAGGAPLAMTAVLLNDTGASASDRITSSPALTGTGDPNAVVHFTVDGQAIAATAQAGADGVWTFTPTGLADGTHTIVASETNAGGTASASLTFTLDSAAPARPAISNFSVDSGFNRHDHFTNDNTITVRGTGQAGTTINLFDGATQVGTATVAANGQWSVATGVLADGSHSFTATDTDVAGNVSLASSSFSVVVDTVAPAVAFTSLTQPNHNSSVTLTGTTGGANNLVLIYDGDNLAGIAVSGSNGSFSFNAGDVSNKDVHAFTAIAIDAAGNIGRSNNDAVVGSIRGDVLPGSSGNDFIIGGSGNDRIIGGLDGDTLTGSGGRDLFVYASIADSQPGAGHYDTITDFSRGNDDIDFRAIAGITGNARLVTTPGQVAAHGISYYQSGSETIVIANASGTANHVDIEIHLRGVIASQLSANDFLHI